MSSTPRIQKSHPTNRMRVSGARSAGRFARAPYNVRPSAAPSHQAGPAPARERTKPRAFHVEKLWENVFAPYRERILYPVAIASALIFIPLAVVDYYRGKVAISAILLCLVAMLAIDAIALYRKKSPPIPWAVLLVPGCAGVAASFATQGIYGALWSFPVVFLSFFALPRRLANVISVALLLVGSAVTYLGQDGGTATRFFLSLALCLVVMNVMLNVLDALHDRLLSQSLTDPLTGAYNRRCLDANLDEAIERHRRNFAPAAALVIDIDHFKRINDRLGHDVGDEVLKSIVALIQERCRKLDQLFRQGGEEFVLLLPDTRAAEALVVAENLREAVATAPILRDQKVTISIGVGELHPTDTAKEWLRRIDEALYRAKEAGRDCVASAERRPPVAVASAAWRRATVN